MKLSEISSAKGLKFNLKYTDRSVRFKHECLIRLEPTNVERSFLASEDKGSSTGGTPVFCEASKSAAEYLHSLFYMEECNSGRCMFAIDGTRDGTLEVQAYIFQSVNSYRTPIEIAVAPDFAKDHPFEKLASQYICELKGGQAVFCMNYKTAKRRNEAIRFVSGRRYLIADKTDRGAIVQKSATLKNKYDVPIDVFIAPKIGFVAQEKQESASPFFNELAVISNPSSYFSRWEAYERLNRKLFEKEAADFGKKPYKSARLRKLAKGTRYEFELDEELEDSCIGLELGVVLPDAGYQGKKSERLQSVGRVVRISGYEVFTLLEYDEDAETISSTGQLALNTSGNIVIDRRRIAARDRIVGNRAPIHDLASLIEMGSSSYAFIGSWGNEKPLTSEFNRNFQRAKSLNAEQVDALSLAINTPDIALIQGPPGTGKTTVIKAICVRYREIFERQERQKREINPSYCLRSPKILITSFQNEAVDNAISEPMARDLPAFRKTSKRAVDSRREQYLRSLEQWYTELRGNISASINNAVVSSYVEAKGVLEDEYLSYKNSGESIKDAAKIINHYLSFVDIPYPEDLVNTAKAIISASVPNQDEDEESPIVSKIESQRTTPEAFEDDGSRNARRLAAYIRVNDDLDISDEMLSAIETVCFEDFTTEDFDAYVRAVEELKAKFCKRQVYIDANDKEAINFCLLTLSDAFSEHYANTLTSTDDKKSIILSEFLERLEQDYESVVEKYSTTTAATCQSSMDLHGDTDKIYDLVIVDEAARANPLDLFIPMSMGRKVILVGDQKQLPHMLEPDILKLLDDGPTGIGDMEGSLFERLFNMYSEGRRPKALKLTRQYRMHPSICQFVSESFYDGLLETADSVTPEMRLCSKAIHDGMPLAFIDIPISRGPEMGGASKSRLCEVEAIGEDVRRILKEDGDRRIGVITFYSAQAKLISDHLNEVLNDEEREYVETGTVDAFQGKEFDYVLLSCVRSNSPRDGSSPRVGFLEKPNRLCVAFSRAIRQLTVYGDARTLNNVPCFARLYSICNEGGGYLATR